MAGAPDTASSRSELGAGGVAALAPAPTFASLTAPCRERAWHPQAETLKRVRNYMIANPASWKKASRSPAFRKNFTLGGDTLSRPPQGYDPAHELIEDLKRKDFACSAQLSEAQICAPDFLKNAVRHFTTAAPLMDWLCGALDLDF